MFLQIKFNKLTTSFCLKDDLMMDSYSYKCHKHVKTKLWTQKLQCLLHDKSKHNPIIRENKQEHENRHNL
jgi:hypothetical protein